MSKWRVVHTNSGIAKSTQHHTIQHCIRNSFLHRESSLPPGTPYFWLSTVAMVADKTVGELRDMGVVVVVAGLELLPLKQGVTDDDFEHIYS